MLRCWTQAFLVEQSASLVEVHSLLIAVTVLLWSNGSLARHMGLIFLMACGIFPDQDQTHVLAVAGFSTTNQAKL